MHVRSSHSEETPKMSDEGKASPDHRDQVRHDDGDREEARDNRDNQNRDRERRRNSPNREGRGREMSTSLLVRNLSYQVRADELRKAFSKYGEVRDVYLPQVSTMYHHVLHTFC